MGSSPPAAPEDSLPSAGFLAVFRAHADAAGTMTFARFMELALYHPEVGYYRRAGPRVGYAAGTDFFTASTSGPLFGELVSAACTTLLRANGRTPETHVFVEIGAENDTGVLAGVNHPFAGVRVVKLGDAIELAGECVVFSNELFDAQPCVRTVFRAGAWREIGVRLNGDRLIEVELPCDEREPAMCSEGYRIDRPLAATALAEAIARQPWRGLFVAFDYGKTWRQLTEETPAGTARAYFRHTQSNVLLARPGEQDLTCHVCWDWLEEALMRQGFAAPKLESQEAFLVRHAGELIAAISAAEAAGFSARKRSLAQLLHPAHLGQKFQVLHALR
jgi:SAM-dependent MidA family methyltransferase